MSGEDDRQNIEELLPFYLNGTLDADERQLVEDALAQDEVLRDELSFLEAIRDDVRSRDTAASPGEFGLARLMRDIEREGAQTAPQRSNVWKIAASVAIALFAAQSLYVVTQSGPDFELAGGGSESLDGTILIVGFSETATEGDIRNLLLDLGLEIVGGPSAIGLYSIIVPEGVSVADTETALSSAAIVDSVETE